MKYAVFLLFVLAAACSPNKENTKPKKASKTVLRAEEPACKISRLLMLSSVENAVFLKENNFDPSKINFKSTETKNTGLGQAVHLGMSESSFKLGLEFRFSEMWLESLNLLLKESGGLNLRKYLFEPSKLGLRKLEHEESKFYGLWKPEMIRQIDSLEVNGMGKLPCLLVTAYAAGKWIQSVYFLSEAIKQNPEIDIREQILARCTEAEFLTNCFSDLEDELPGRHGGNVLVNDFEVLNAFLQSIRPDPAEEKWKLNPAEKKQFIALALSLVKKYG